MKHKKKHTKIKYRVYRKDKNIRKKLEEQRTLYMIAQQMLMRVVIRYIDDKDYVNLKQFCLTYG